MAPVGHRKIGKWIRKTRTTFLYTQEHLPIFLTTLTNNRGEYFMSLHRGWRRSAPFCERLRNRRIVAFGMPYEAICPTVSDGDMTVIRQDVIPILALFPSKSSILELRAG